MSDTASTVAITTDELDALVAANLPRVEAEIRRRTFEPLTKEALAWLAASDDVPPGVVSLLFPNEPSDSPSIMALVAAGVLEPRTSARREPRYSVSDRQPLIRELRERLPTTIVRAILAPTAEAVLSKSPDELSDDVLRLAHLVHDSVSDENLAEVFERRVNDAFDRNDAVAALEWTATGRSLATLLTAYVKPDLGYAVERAARNVELLQRRREDRQHLRNFVERREQMEAINELMAGPDDRWALHLLGAGGVGKTMLVRYLTVHADALYGAAVARVDFDYLNPDYPRRHPGLLLWALAQELRIYDVSGDARELFDKAASMLNDVQRNTATNPSARATDDPLFVSAVMTWNLALNALPNRKIVLILDTCEELAKIRQEPGQPSSVDETFRILQAVHDGAETLTDGPARGGVSKMRVVFAGRRPLARSGPGWSSPTTSLPPRDFLMLHELRGFTDPEARAFLDALGVEEDLVEPILKNAPEAPRPADIQTFEPTYFGSRYNPFLLNYYGRFAAEEPQTARQIPTEAWDKRYIELRFLRRIKFPPLTDALPVIAAARHVDAAFLRAVTELGDADVARLMAELSDSEWTDARYVASRESAEPKRIISLKPQIQRDLVAYYRARPSVETRAIERGAEYLRKLTLEADLSELDWTSFDAALWMLGRREESIAWWAAVERRAIDERGYEWLLKVTSNLIDGESAAAAREGHEDELPLRAMVLASHAAAFLNLRREGVAGIWADVEASLKGRGEPAWSPLARRAKLGILANRSFAGAVQLASMLKQTAQTFVEEIATLRESFDVQRLAMIVAACENVLEHLEELETNSEVKSSLAQRIREHIDTVIGIDDEYFSVDTSTLRAFLESLSGRASVLTGHEDLALHHLRKAVEIADRSSGDSFFDWIPPGDLRSRTRLELIRGAYPNIASARALLAIVADMTLPPNGEDSERLLSARLNLEAAFGVVDPKRVIDRMGWIAERIDVRSEEELRTFRGQCAAHRATRPLFVTAASILAGAGRLDEAVSILIFARDSSKIEPLSAREADRLLLDLVFRYRLHEESIGITPGPSAASRDAADKARVWSVDAWTGRPEALDKARLDDPREAHAAWIATPAISKEDRHKAAAWKWKRESENLTPVLVAQLRLDEEEQHLLGLREQSDPYRESVRANRATTLRIALRRRALKIEDYTDIEKLAEHLGWRAAAMMALDDGTHLLLRLRSRATILFGHAKQWFEKCHDNTGIFLATVNDALARIASKQDADIDPAMDAYGALRLGLLLPDIRELMSTFDSATIPEKLLDTVPRAWRPMVGRFVLANLLRHEGARKEMKTVTRDFFAKRTAKVSVDVQVVLDATKKTETLTPTEGVIFTVVFAAIVLGIGAAIFYNVPWQHPTSLVARGAAILGYGIAAAALLGLVIYKDTREATFGCGLLFALTGGLFWAFTKLMSPWIGDFSIWWKIGIFIGVTGVLIAAFVIGINKRNAAVALATDLTMTISPEGDARSRRAKISLLVRKPRFHFFRSPHFSRGDATQQHDFAIETGGFAPYRDFAAGAPDGLVKELKKIVDPLEKERELVATLVTTPELAGPAWEAIACARVEDVAPAKARLRFRRTVADRGASTRRSWHGPFLVAGWAATELASSVIKQAWELGQVRMRMIRESSIASASAISEDTRVLHIIAAFDERSSGVGIRAAGTGSDAGDVRIDRAETVRRRVPSAEICIVQPELLESPRRSESDRQDAMLARRFAAELILAGFPIVIALPRLTPDAVIHSIPVLIPRILDGDLVDAVRAMQRRIGDASPNDEIPWESACDVTLFTA